MKKLLGMLLIPFLFVRGSLIFPLIFIIYHYPNFLFDRDVFLKAVEVLSVLSFGWVVVATFIAGNLNLLSPILKKLHKWFNISYREINYYDDMYAYSVWRRVNVEVNGKNYIFNISRRGSNVYDYKTKLMRKVLYVWLWD